VALQLLLRLLHLPLVDQGCVVLVGHALVILAGQRAHPRGTAATWHPTPLPAGSTRRLRGAPSSTSTTWPSRATQQRRRLQACTCWGQLLLLLLLLLRMQVLQGLLVGGGM
jgi:hypothetical protein